MQFFQLVVYSSINYSQFVCIYAYCLKEFQWLQKSFPIPNIKQRGNILPWSISEWQLHSYHISHDYDSCTTITITIHNKANNFIKVPPIIILYKRKKVGSVEHTKVE